MQRCLKILCFFLAFLIISSPTFATDGEDSTGKDDAQVYQINDELDLVTTMRMFYSKSPKTFIKAVFPQLDGSEDRINTINAFNTLVTDIIQQEKATYRKNAAQNQSLLKNPTDASHNRMYMDYAASVIKTGSHPIISIRFNLQGYLAGMAHPFHYHRTLNYDVKTEQALTLSDLFSPEADYLSVIANYCREVLDKRLTDHAMVAEGTAPKADNYKNWNIKPNGILITFDEYQVAPYVYGAQTVLIPFSELKPILAEDSFLAKCIKNTNTCRRQNLLTGGFIDEAVNSSHRTLNPVLGKV